MTESQILAITGGQRLATDDEIIANVLKWHDEREAREALEAEAALRGCSIARIKWERRMAEKKLSKDLRHARRFKAHHAELRLALGELIGKL